MNSNNTNNHYSDLIFSQEYLPEEYRETLFMLRAKHRANISPRPLLLWLRDLCDDLFDPELACRSAGEKVDRISVIRRFHQNTEREFPG